MVVLALTRKSAQNERLGRAAEALAYDGADRMEATATDVRLVGMPERRTGTHPVELTVADFRGVSSPSASVQSRVARHPGLLGSWNRFHQ
jgi:hypothetical protein